MKKLSYILCLILLLGACAAPAKSPDATIIESKDPKDYSILIPFEASSIRYNHGIYTGAIDILDIGTRLQEHAKKVFSVDDFYLAEGQILDVNRVNNLLKREGTDNPYGLNPPKGSQFETGIGNIKILDAVLVADIFEINFYMGTPSNPVLSGIGFALVFNQSMEVDGFTTLISDEKLKEFALTAGRKLERYIRTIQGLETLNIYMALYSTEKIDATLPGHFFAEATFSAREGQFIDLDEEWVFFPSQAALVKDVPTSTSFSKLRNTIVDFMPEAIGTVGEGLYVDGELSTLKITVNMQAKTYTEVYALTQTIISLLDEFNHTKYDIIVKVVSSFQTVALIKLTLDDQLSVIIAPLGELMEKQPKSYFINLAHQLRFDLSDKEAQDIADEFSVLIDQMDLLNKIDTQGVEPMVYPFEEPTSFMREDEVNHVLSAQEALKNAPSTKNGFFVTKKVVL